MKPKLNLLKIVSCIVGLGVILVFILLNAESYEIINKKTENTIVEAEIKKIFGRKISECTINSSGLYDGPAKSWHLFNKTLRNEGNFSNGYWHGKWNEYNRDGQLVMIREWNMGVLEKAFSITEGNSNEIPRVEWPSYVNVKQHNPQHKHQ